MSKTVAATVSTGLASEAKLTNELLPVARAKFMPSIAIMHMGHWPGRCWVSNRYRGLTMPILCKDG